MLDNGTIAESRAGVTRELLHAALVVQNPTQRWVSVRHPAMNPAFALAEAVWILNGRSDAAFLAHWNPVLTKYVGNDRNLHGAYGARLRHGHGLDQLRLAHSVLKSNPQSRQVVLQIWQPGIDLPDSNGQPRAQDIPCNLSSCLKVRGGRLHWLQTLRSNDLFLGVPHNFVQFTMLQEIMAGWLSLELGEYTQVSDSLHLYSSDQRPDLIDTTIIAAQNSDRFKDNFETSTACFRKLATVMDALLATDLRGLAKIHAKGLELPMPYRNMFAVIAADDSRRRGENRESSRLMSQCSNGCYVQLWDRWYERCTRLRT